MRRSFVLLGLLAATTPAYARDRKVEVHPYLGLDQTVVADLKGGSNDTLSYASVTAGVDARIHNRSTEVQVDLAYQHQFSWTKRQPDSNVVSGIAKARTSLLDEALTIEGGALATRVRTDGYTGANGNPAGAGSRANVYSLYAGPTLRTHVGALEVKAAYRLGYNRVESGFDSVVTGGTPPLDSFSDSVNHYATASVGTQAGDVLPVGVAVGVGYQREDASQLDQRFEDKWARLDMTAPVTQDIAVVGGVGYEAIRISNRDALRDVGGNPVRDANGRFVTDPASPRLLSYDNSEMIWDAGILWRPSRRTSLSLTYGHRYGSESVTGSFSWQPDKRTSVNISLFDSIDSFGRALSGDLANVPDNFLVARNPFTGDIGGCAVGQGGGSCFSDTLTGIRTANFRNRGVSGSYVHTSGPWKYGIGLGYSQRKFLGDDAVFAGISGAKDEVYYAAMALGYAIDGRSGIDANLYANQFKSGIVGIPDVSNAGAYLNYHRRMGRKLQMHAALGVDEVHRSGVESLLSAIAQFGLRYQF